MFMRGCVRACVYVCAHTCVSKSVCEPMAVHARVCGLSWCICVCMCESLAFLRPGQQVSTWHVRLYLQNRGFRRLKERSSERPQNCLKSIQTEAGLPQ